MWDYTQRLGRTNIYIIIGIVLYKVDEIKPL